MMHRLLYIAQIVSGNQIPHTPADTTHLQAGFKILYEIVGSLAVLMLVIAGLRYILRSDDSNAVAESKRMIIYTLIGLIVIVVAGTIVNYILQAMS